MRTAKTTSQRIDPDMKKEEGPVISARDQILARITGEIGKPDTFAVAVGESLLYFRRPENAEDIRRFEKAGLEFMGRVTSKAEREKLPTHLKEALEFASQASTEDLINAFTISYWSVDPEKITQAQAIKFTRDPVLVDNLVSHINHQHAHGLRVMTLGGVEIAKKNSKPTSESSAQ